ncbi:hypothetical protein [Corynebacterium sp.]|uniref:hypothetical protein n=1 Tax=Corynebacterium sp. TaxID=1720 RepID=UPI0026DF2BEA|nr:hypothetical protein [Corynebacterium sp.]MDO5513216.1 hypothetical protein [Corynebacterium sp.]
MTTLAPALHRWLGAADSSDPDAPWTDVDPSTPDMPSISTGHAAVLSISGLPRRLRPRIESLIADCLPEDSPLEIPGADPLTANWFISWHRSAGPDNRVYVACRQVLYAAADQLRDLDEALTTISRDHGFQAEVREIEK